MTRILFCSICVVIPVFITRIGMKEIDCIFSLRSFLAEKVHFSCFIRNWEEIESLENEKSPGKVLEFFYPISV